MKYPYIGQLTNKAGFVALFAGSGFACNLSNPEEAWSDAPLNDFVSDWHEDAFKNITREYLANTYGKVASKEHAEFIFELCRVNGIPAIYSSKPSEAKSFEVNKGYISLHSIGINELNVSSQKLITIPLPPKQIQTATSEEEFEMRQIMKNNGDNLILGCEDSKCEEWPQIGDEVIIFNQHNELRGELLALTKEYAIISQHYGEQHLHLSGCKFKKPKTPEEELRDDIVQTIHDDVYHGAYEKQPLVVFADALMTKYNITKKPQ